MVRRFLFTIQLKRFLKVSRQSRKICLDCQKQMDNLTWRYLSERGCGSQYSTVQIQIATFYNLFAAVQKASVEEKSGQINGKLVGKFLASTTFNGITVSMYFFSMWSTANEKVFHIPAFIILAQADTINYNETPAFSVCFVIHSTFTCSAFLTTPLHLQLQWWIE